jgi:hypothetical protein
MQKNIFSGARGYFSLGFACLIIGGLFFSCLLPVQAQGAGQAKLISPDPTQFPQINFFLDVYNSSGQFVPDLQPDQVVINEDGQKLSPQKLTLVNPGVQFVVAINPGLIYLNRFNNGTILDQLRKNLEGWVKKQPTEPVDNFSLSTNKGLIFTRLTDPLEWTAALQAYKPDMARDQASLVSLSSAIDLISDPAVLPEMKKAILYITPMPSSVSLAGLPNISERAARAGVRVFVWLIGTPNSVNLPGAEALKNFSAASGGQFFLFSGRENLPEIESYLQPLRNLYQVEYTSKIQQSGEHQLSVQINRPDLTFETTPVSIALTVLPPNPIFVSPPDQVERKLISAADRAKPIYAPVSILIKTMVEFPDHHPRELVKVELLADGEVVASRTTAPFDLLEWPIDQITETGVHRLQIHVVDQLGLEQSSIQTLANVQVEPLPKTWLETTFSSERIQIITAILAVLVVLAIVLLINWRRINKAKKTARGQKASDPVTQSVPIRQEKMTTQLAGKEVKSWPRSSLGRSAAARLVRLDEYLHPISGSSISVSQQEITFGSDPLQSTILLHSPSVAPLHARLYQGQNEVFILADLNSIAGTWVNYAPISSQGIKLKHGDLINIGRIMFRFEQANPKNLISPTEPPMDEPL